MILSGSKLPIARHCAWFARPDASYPAPPDTSEASEGRELHRALAAYLNEKPGLPLSPELALLFAQASEWIAPRREFAQAEISYAYDPATRSARVIGIDIDRDYEPLIRPGEIPCTVDYIIPNGTGTELTVGDWKSGYGAHIEPTVENAQLLFGGLCASLAHRVPEVTLETVFIRNDAVYCDRAVVSLELSLFQEELHRILDGIATAEAVSGQNCQFCPALGACPATRSLLADATPGGIEKPIWTTEFISEANDVAMALQLSTLRKAVDMVGDALKARVSARGGRLELPGERVYREVVSKRTGFDKEKALEILGARAAECTYETETVSMRVTKR